MKAVINGVHYVPIVMLERALLAQARTLSAYRALVEQTNSWTIPDGLTERQQENIRATLNGIERMADRAEKEAEKLQRDIDALRAAT